MSCILFNEFLYVLSIIVLLILSPISSLLKQFGASNTLELISILQSIMADPSKLSTKDGLQMLNQVLEKLKSYNGSIIIQPDLIVSVLKVFKHIFKTQLPLTKYDGRHGTR
jgi:hypothetical protein